jgi:hypothetical protein
VDHAQGGDARHPPILDLINGYAAKGVMLPRTEFEMSEAIRDFTVVTLGEGCWAAARCIFTVPVPAKSARWRCRSRPRRTAWAASWWKLARQGSPGI